MEDNELVKVVKSHRENPVKQTWGEFICSLGKAIKHFTYGRYYNTEEYQRVEAARKFVKVYDLFYNPWEKKVSM